MRCAGSKHDFMSPPQQHQQQLYWIRPSLSTLLWSVLPLALTTKSFCATSAPQNQPRVGASQPLVYKAGCYLNFPDQICFSSCISWTEFSPVFITACKQKCGNDPHEERTEGRWAQGQSKRVPFVTSQTENVQGFCIACLCVCVCWLFCDCPPPHLSSHTQPLHLSPIRTQCTGFGFTLTRT